MKHFPVYFAEHSLPVFVVRDIQEFLDCGDIKRRYAWLKCMKCAARIDICLRCKRRGWCPPCMRFRQLDRADFLQQRVIGNTPMRQWVLTLPPPLRIKFAFAPRLVSKILSRFLDYVFQFLCRQAKRLHHVANVRQAHAGSVTAIQRFSTDLSLNLHFHCLVTDGVFVRLTPDGPVTFVRLPAPTTQQLTALATKICKWTRNLLIREGVWQDIHEASVSSLPTVYGILSMGPETPRAYRFCGVASDQETDEPVGRNGVYAFNLYARESVGAGDRKNLRNLLKYILSPPFGDDQLRPDPDSADHVLLDLKRAMRDGTQTLRLTNHQMLDRLVWITPRPRANLIRFHGVYAPNSKLRSEVVPEHVPAPKPPPDAEEGPDDYKAWGELLTHSYPHDVMRCRRCGGRMKLIALKSDRITYRRRSGIPPDHPAGSAWTKTHYSKAA